jgi:hypothetical protein
LTSLERPHIWPDSFFANFLSIDKLEKRFKANWQGVTLKMRCYVVYDVRVLLGWLRFANHDSHQYTKFPAVSLKNDTAFHELDNMLGFALYDYFVKTRIIV